MKRMLLTLLGAALVTLSLVVVAEEIKLPVGQQAAGQQTIERPSRGMSSQQVEARYGIPLTKHEAVGTPPISSWEYADYLVYFEYSHVLHTVLKHRPINE